MPTTTYAIVGLGSVARTALNALRSARSSTAHALVSGEPNKALAWAEEFHVPATYTYATYDQLLADPELQAVYIALPNALHAEYTIRALEAGKHVLCEKPLAASAEQAHQMAATAGRTGSRLMTAYRLHFDPANRAAMAATRSRGAGTGELDLGPVHQLSAARSFRLGNRSPWRLDSRLAGGGSLYDVGIYALQAARYLTGQEPTSVMGQIQAPPGGVEMDSQALLTFPYGATAAIRSSYRCAADSFLVSQERGWMELAAAFDYYGPRELRWQEEEQAGTLEMTTRHYPAHNEFTSEFDYFSLCLQQDRPPEPSGWEGYWDMAIMDAIYQSARLGRPVDLPPPPPGLRSPLDT